IPDGSLIAVKPVGLTELKNGDIVVFSNGYEYSVKRYYKHDDKLVFRPESSNLAHYDQTYSIIYSITAKKIRGQLSPLFFISMRKKTPFLMFRNLKCLRSEEHTSELQSRFDLVCRLLLEKKKLLYFQIINYYYTII